MEKGGLWAALQTEGLKRGEEGVFAEEMRLGRLGQGRRVWGKQSIELRYEWVYWVLEVDAMQGRLW